MGEIRKESSEPAKNDPELRRFRQPRCIVNKAKPAVRRAESWSAFRGVIPTLPSFFSLGHTPKRGVLWSPRGSAELWTQKGEVRRTSFVSLAQSFRKQVHRLLARTQDLAHPAKHLVGFNGCKDINLLIREGFFGLRLQRRSFAV